MEKKGKKYLIKESELKEIIREMMLMELYNPDDYKGMYTPGYNHDAHLPTTHDYLSGLLKTGGGLLKMGTNAIIPDAWKEAAANANSDVGQYLLGLLGAQKAGTARPDWIQNWNQMWGAQGSNEDAHQELNVNAAAIWLRNNAGRKTSGSCAKYVRRALNRGGLQVPHGMRASSAKYYYNILKSNGWDEIPVNQAGQLCDVVVIAPCVDNRGASHPDGHIAMCIGNGVWASDFIQRNMYGLAGVPPASAVHVFRYRNRVQ